jgi:hypothetical protein
MRELPKERLPQRPPGDAICYILSTREITAERTKVETFVRGHGEIRREIRPFAVVKADKIRATFVRSRTGVQRTKVAAWRIARRDGRAGWTLSASARRRRGLQMANGRGAAEQLHRIVW